MYCSLLFIVTFSLLLACTINCGLMVNKNIHAKINYELFTLTHTMKPTYNQKSLVSIKQIEKQVVKHDSVIQPSNKAMNVQSQSKPTIPSPIQSSNFQNYSTILYTQIPICTKTRLRLVLFGGFGNQFNLFSFAYLISSLEKIPLELPEDSAFITHFKIHEFYKNQIYTYPQKDHLNQMKYLNRRGLELNNTYISINGIRGSSKYRSLLHNRTLCTSIHVPTVILFGYEVLGDLFYEDPQYIPTMKQLHLYSSDIYTYQSPTHPNRYNTFLLRNFLTPSSSIVRFMRDQFPNYDNSTFISAHIRFGSSIADFSDNQRRMAIQSMLNVKKYLKNYLLKSNCTFMYVASDSTRFKKYLKRSIYSRLFMLPLPQIDHTDLLLHDTNSKMSTTNLYAISELLLLTYGTECIGSQYSSYSNIGCGNTHGNAIFLPMT
ncbi:hypothetical protein WA158_007759 [Blastocystis sp. Blastoise]